MPREQGNILFLILVILVLGGSYSLLAGLERDFGSAAREERTAAALAQAREALIAHAVTFGESHRSNADPVGSKTADDITLPPGTLPCPENASSLNEGAASSPCGARDVPAIGRLPWRSLGMAPLRDAAGECLWYAVSGSFKANPPPHLLNWDSRGDFDIRDGRGRTLASQVVAVIFSPGLPLPGQNRSASSGTAQCGGNYNPAAYLDSTVIDGIAYANSAAAPAGSTSAFVAGPVRDAKGNTVVNDRIAYITRDDLFAKGIERRGDFPGGYLYDPADSQGNDPARYALAQKLAACLAGYGRSNASPGDLRLPWAAPLAPASFDNAAFDDQSGLYAGRPPYRVGTSRGTTDNKLVPPGCSGSDDCRLLIIERCPAGWWRVAGKPLDGDGGSRKQSPEGWWDRWKDHFFYVVAPEYAPNSRNNWSENPNPCILPGNQCIEVGGHRYAAAIVFAGRAASGQKRGTLAERQDAANYLEGGVLEAFAFPAGAQPRVLAPAGNDRLVCLAPDLSLRSDCR